MVEQVRLRSKIFQDLTVKNCRTNDLFSMRIRAEPKTFVRWFEVMKDDVQSFDCFVLVIDQSNKKKGKENEEEREIDCSYIKIIVLSNESQR